MNMINWFKKKIRNQKYPKEPLFFTKDFFDHPNYRIGEYSYGKPLVLDWGEGSKLTIGKFCSIAENVTIFLGGNHRTDWISTYPFNVLFNDFPNAKGIEGHPATKGDVVIGNDVWIGKGASILSGITIGDGAVIGTNAVVSKNVEPYAIIVGNPGIEIKKRFDLDTINLLLSIKWWDWTNDQINEKIEIILSNRFEELK